MNTVKYISSKENQYYPTPKELAFKMLENLNRKKLINNIKTILEPSAGAGNLIEYFYEDAYNKITPIY